MQLLVQITAPTLELKADGYSRSRTSGLVLHLRLPFTRASEMDKD